MTKTDIFSGFLGAGKTTLIRKLIAESYQNEKLVLIENEFGDIAIDGGFLRDAGIQITEMNSGCICCTLVGDFRKALEQVVRDYAPDRIIIEPSGVGKLSDVAKAVSSVDGIEIGARVTLVDASKCKMYMRNFGEFFNDQVINADLIVLSRTGDMKEEKILQATELLRTLNPDCTIITTPWDQISGEQIRNAMEENGLKHAVEELTQEHHHHHNEEECDDPECACHHHHDDDDDEEEHEHHHHHHDDDDDDEEHEHHHHHDDEECDDPECSCHHHHDHDDDEDEEHEHHHHHHHHHHADEIFDSLRMETPRKFTAEEISSVLDALHDEEKYGIVLRAKGYVDGKDGSWIYFDYVPEEKNIRTGTPAVTGRFCVIGSKIDHAALKELFRVE